MDYHCISPRWKASTRWKPPSSANHPCLSLSRSSIPYGGCVPSLIFLRRCFLPAGTPWPIREMCNLSTVSAVVQVGVDSYKLGSRLCTDKTPIETGPSFLSDITDLNDISIKQLALYPYTSWFLYQSFTARCRKIGAEYINLEDCVSGKSCFLVPVQFPL